MNTIHTGREPGKIAVIQIAVPDTHKTNVFQLRGIVGATGWRGRAFPAPLKALLESDTYVKAGCGISTDVAKLKADYGVVVANAVDVVKLAHDKGLFPHARASLDDVSTALLNAGVAKGKWVGFACGGFDLGRRRKPCGMRLTVDPTKTYKPQSDPTIRLSAWDDRELSQQQLEYAALDAYALLRVFERVHRRRTTRDFAKLTKETAVPGTEVVLLARGMDYVVARGRIRLGPTERGTAGWVPEYLEGAAGAAAGVKEQKRTTARVVVSLAAVVAAGVNLLYPSEAEARTLGAALERQRERGQEGLLHVLWDIARVLVVDDAGGGDAGQAGGEGGGGEEEGEDGGGEQGAAAGSKVPRCSVDMTGIDLPKPGRAKRGKGKCYHPRCSKCPEHLCRDAACSRCNQG